jgi:copper(I)-binding protein
MQQRRVAASGLAIVMLAVVVAACGAPAGPAIKVEDVWARPAVAMDDSMSGGSSMGPGMAGTGAVFMRLVNQGEEADCLRGGTTDVAKAVEIHETKVEGGVATMQMLPDGLEVPARGQVLLQPGGYHVMLVGMQRTLEVGDRFTLNLQFEKSGILTVQAEVRQP